MREANEQELAHDQEDFDRQESEASDEDEVVAEFDICLAGSLRDQLQLLQYPLRPNYRHYGDQGTLKEVQVTIESRSKE